MPAIPVTDVASQFYSYPLSGATAAAFPALDGLVLHDALQDVAVTTGPNSSAKVQVQDRVVRSTATGLVDFYYRLTNVGTQPVHVAYAFVGFWVEELNETYVLAPITFGDFRPDGLGTVQPLTLELWPYGTGGAEPGRGWRNYAFRFDHTFAPGESSRFFFVSTKLTEFTVGPGGLGITTSDAEANFGAPQGGETAANPLVKGPGAG